MIDTNPSFIYWDLFRSRLLLLVLISLIIQFFGVEFAAAPLYLSRAAAGATLSRPADAGTNLYHHTIFFGFDSALKIGLALWQKSHVMSNVHAEDLTKY